MSTDTLATPFQVDVDTVRTDTNDQPEDASPRKRVKFEGPVTAKGEASFLTSVLTAMRPPTDASCGVGIRVMDRKTVGKLSIEAVVWKVDNETKSFEGRTFHEMILRLFVVGITPNGAEDVLSTGEPFLSYVLPTTVLRGTSDGGDEKDRDGGKFVDMGRRLEIDEPDHGASMLGWLSVGVNMKEANSNQVVPGDVVSVDGVTLKHPGMYMKGERVVVVRRAPGAFSSPVVQHRDVVISNLMNVELRSTKMLENAASTLAFALGQFVPKATNVSHLFEDDAPRRAFAATFGERLKRAVHQLESQCTERLTRTSSEATTKTLANHAERLHTYHDDDRLFRSVAHGDTNLFLAARAKASDEQFQVHCAPLLHDVKWHTDSTWYTTQPTSKRMLDSSCDGVDFPEQQVVPTVAKVEYEQRCVRVFVKLFFAGPRTKDVSSDEYTFPVVESDMQCDVAFKHALVHTLEWSGNNATAKAPKLAMDMYRYGVWSAVVGVHPRAMEASASPQLPCPFVKSVLFDMQPTLANMALLVSESFVIKHLAGGATQYVYDPDEMKDVVMGKDGKPYSFAAPRLMTDGYQEITLSSFKFAQSKMPPHKSARTYRVWFDQVHVLIQEDLQVLTDVEKGDAAVLRASADAGCESIGDFMRQTCAVYCVATTP